MPLKERNITNKTKTGDIASSMTDGFGASVRFGSRGLLSAWDGVGLPVSVIKYDRCQNETTVMKVADLAANFTAELNFPQEAKAVKNLDKLQDAIDSVDKSTWLGEIRCLETIIEFELAENGTTTSKPLEKRGTRAHSATENTNACISNVVAKYGSEEVTRATLNSGEGLESVTDESTQNTETSLQAPRKSEESRHAFNELGENYRGVQQTGETFRFSFLERKDQASANRVFKTITSNPIRFGEKIKGLLQNLTNQFKIATNCRTLKQKSTNEFAQNASFDMVIEAVENRTGEILSINSSKKNLAEFRVKSLLIADNTMLRALSYKAVKQAAKISATILQTLNLKYDSMLSPVIYMEISHLRYSEE